MRRIIIGAAAACAVVIGGFVAVQAEPDKEDGETLTREETARKLAEDLAGIQRIIDEMSRAPSEQTED